jgi:hypothetical protein
VPVARFQGSRLASGSVAAPYEQNGSRKDSTEKGSRDKKARVSTSGSSLSAAVVEAEIGLEAQVLHLILFGKILYLFKDIFMVSSEPCCNFHRNVRTKKI